MITKLKIRKIESSVEDIFNRLNELLNVSERIPRDEFYSGTSIKEICSSLGIKELEFWEITINNKNLFKEKFEITSIRRFDSKVNLLMRRSTYDKLYRKKDDN